MAERAHPHSRAWLGSDDAPAPDRLSEGSTHPWQPAGQTLASVAPNAHGGPASEWCGALSPGRCRSMGTGCPNAGRTEAQLNRDEPSPHASAQTGGVPEPPAPPHADPTS